MPAAMMERITLVISQIIHKGVLCGLHYPLIVGCYLSNHRAAKGIRKQIPFLEFRNLNRFALPLKKWSGGRVARLSSAKAATAVRIRSRPLTKTLVAQKA